MFIPCSVVVFPGTTCCSSQTHVVFCFRDYLLFKSDPCCILFQGLPVVQVRPMLYSVSRTTRCSSQTYVVFCFRDYPLIESDLCCCCVFGDYPLFKSDLCCCCFCCCFYFVRREALFACGCQRRHSCKCNTKYKWRPASFEING